MEPQGSTAEPRKQSVGRGPTKCSVLHSHLREEAVGKQSFLYSRFVPYRSHMRSLVCSAVCVPCLRIQGLHVTCLPSLRRQGAWGLLDSPRSVLAAGRPMTCLWWFWGATPGLPGQAAWVASWPCPWPRRAPELVVDSLRLGFHTHGMGVVMMSLFCGVWGFNEKMCGALSRVPGTLQVLLRKCASYHVKSVFFFKFTYVFLLVT